MTKKRNFIQKQEEAQKNTHKKGRKTINCARSQFFLPSWYRGTNVYSMCRVSVCVPIRVYTWKRENGTGRKILISRCRSGRVLNERGKNFIFPNDVSQRLVSYFNEFLLDFLCLLLDIALCWTRYCASYIVEISRIIKFMEKSYEMN